MKLSIENVIQDIKNNKIRKNNYNELFSINLNKMLNYV